MGDLKCEACGAPVRVARRVSVHGMYDCHCFEPFTGKTPDALVDSWLEFIKEPTLATFSKGGPQHNIGVPDLCPAIVLDGDENELRRVGVWVRAREGKPDPAEVAAYRAALKADPDIPRILAGA